MKLKTTWLYVLLLLTPVCLAYTQEQFQQVDEVVRDFQEANNLPGLSVSIGKKGLLVFSGGYGYADLEHLVPVYPSITKFRVGSVAKPMTSVAIGQLVESGQLDLDAPIQQYVPEFPVKAEGTITTRLLGGHLAGIRHYESQEELYVLHHYTDVFDALKMFADDPLVSPPSEQYAYSSYGYNLLSAVIQGASGKDYVKYMEQEVFAPLNMNNTLADQVSDLIPGRASAYVRGQDGMPINAPPADNSYKWAGGGFLSTSEDLVRFGFGMLYSDILSDETKQMLWTSQQTKDGSSTGYGIGWRVFDTDSGDRVIMHTGGSIGGTTYFAINLTDEIVLAMISNYSGGQDLAPLLLELNAILGKPSDS